MSATSHADDDEAAFDLAEAHRRVANVVRLGRISAVADRRARVRFDADWESAELPVFQLHAGSRVRSWVAPTVGEQVAVFSMSGETEAGVIVRGLHSDDMAEPSTAAGLVVMLAADGSVVESYDLDAHVRTLALPADGRFVVTVGSSTLTLEDGVTRIQAERVEIGA